MLVSKQLPKFISIFPVVSVSLLIAACGGENSVTDSSDVAQTQSSDNNASPDIPGSIATSAIGDVFIFGEQNRTLYTFANDTEGVSTCFDSCLEAWPPAAASSEETIGQFSTVARDDGTFQWRFKNQPLYYYQGDGGQGDVNGEGLGGVWYVSRPDPITTEITQIGDVLVGSGTISSDGVDAALRRDVDGYTLYTFRNDTIGDSSCTGSCAEVWPPFYADRGAAANDGLTLISRGDGTLQWARQGQPLYLYQGDSAPGDTNGEGVNGVWDAARPLAE